MPTATTLSGWRLINVGPATTTFTAPSSCSTAYRTAVGPSADPTLANWGVQCPWAPPVDCNPFGTKIQSSISSADSPTAKPSNALFILYQSPGIACNAGQETIGSAEKLTPTSTSVSGYFTDVVSAVPTDESYPYFPNQLEVVLAALEAGGTAIVCCPSGYTPGQGACYSALPSSVYKPSVGCHLEPADDSYGTANGTWGAAGGKTITGQLIRPTGTLPFSTVTTTFAQSDISSSVGVAIEGMGILIQRSSDLEKAPGPVSAGVTTTAPTAATTSKMGAASRTGSNWSVQGVLVTAWCVAFVLGTM